VNALEFHLKTSKTTYVYLVVFNQQLTFVNDKKRIISCTMYNSWERVN
jgi:hypothetical protein